MRCTRHGPAANPPAAVLDGRGRFVLRSALGDDQAAFDLCFFTSVRRPVATSKMNPRTERV